MKMEKKDKKTSNKTMIEKKAINCGLVIPISSMDDEIYTEEHWNGVKQIIEECLQKSEKYDYKVKIVSESDGANIIQNNIIQGLYKSDIIICDVSNLNPNVMFELGVRIMFDKPVVIIKDSNTKFVFDVSAIEHMIYNRTLHYSETRLFQDNLLKKVECTFEDFKDEKNAPSYLKSFGFIETKPSLETIDVSAVDQIMSGLKSLERRMGNIDYEMITMKKAQKRSSISEELNKLNSINKNRILEEYLLELERYLKISGCQTYDDFKENNEWDFRLGLKNDYSNILGEDLLNSITRNAINSYRHTGSIKNFRNK